MPKVIRQRARTSRSQMPHSAPRRQVPNWLLGLLAPGLATACAYSHWVAYGGVFGVPRALISVQAGDILVAFGTLIVVFLYFNALIAVGNLLIRRLPWWVSEPVSNLLPFIITGSLFAIAVRQATAWLIIGLFLLCFIPIIYGLPLIHQRGTRGYANKLRADTLRVRSNFEDDDLMGPTLIGLLSRRFPEYLSLLAVSVLVLMLSYAAGFGSATSQVVFPATASQPTRIVVAVVADRAFLRALESRPTTTPLEVLSADTLPPLVAASLDATQTLELRSHPWPHKW